MVVTNYTHAIVRHVPDSFLNALKLEQPGTPINLDLAKKQHKIYVDYLKTVVPNVIEVPADNNHPDCVFVEDTCVIIDQVVVIPYLAAESRRGEQSATNSILTKYFKKDDIHFMEHPALCDGGDVLFIPTTRDVIVGLSTRTNKEGVEFLRKVFSTIGCNVVDVPVLRGLHLKTSVTYLSPAQGYEDTHKEIFLAVADNEGGRRMFAEIEALQAKGLIGSGYTYKPVYVPDQLASNILEVNGTNFYQSGFPQSEKVLHELPGGATLKPLPQLSENAKVDGALTCCSVLFTAKEPLN